MKLCYLQARFESESPATSDYDKVFNLDMTCDMLGAYDERLDDAKKYVDSIFNRIADNHKEFVGKVVKVLTVDLSEDDLQDLNVDLDDYQTWIYIGDDSIDTFKVEYELKRTTC